MKEPYDKGPDGEIYDSVTDAETEGSEVHWREEGLNRAEVVKNDAKNGDECHVTDAKAQACKVGSSTIPDKEEESERAKEGENHKESGKGFHWCN